jgi:hypothetical protein
MISICETLAKDGREITLQAILDDLSAGEMDALYYASETQIMTLIEREQISEDYLSRHQAHQEDMRYLMASVLREFGA